MTNDEQKTAVKDKCSTGRVVRDHIRGPTGEECRLESDSNRKMFALQTESSQISESVD